MFKLNSKLQDSINKESLGCESCWHENELITLSTYRTEYDMWLCKQCYRNSKKEEVENEK